MRRAGVGAGMAGRPSVYINTYGRRAAAWPRSPARRRTPERTGVGPPSRDHPPTGRGAVGPRPAPPGGRCAGSPSRRAATSVGVVMWRHAADPTFHRGIAGTAQGPPMPGAPRCGPDDLASAQATPRHRRRRVKGRTRASRCRRLPGTRSALAPGLPPRGVCGHVDRERVNGAAQKP